MVYEGEEKRFLYLVSFETKIFIKFIKLRAFLCCSLSEWGGGGVQRTYLPLKDRSYHRMSGWEVPSIQNVHYRLHSITLLVKDDSIPNCNASFLPNLNVQTLLHIKAQIFRERKCLSLPITFVFIRLRSLSFLG